jgi:hypothetical protein
MGLAISQDHLFVGCQRTENNDIYSYGYL